jgi:hypothetical protein
MSNVVEFQSPAQLRKMLAEREAELAELKNNALATSGVKEMLKLQILDLKDQMDGVTSQVAAIQQNLDNLLKKLDS